MRTKITRIQHLKRFCSALVGRDLFTSSEATCACEWHGSSYGGWVVCGSQIEKGGRIYSLGVGEDVSFDISVLERYPVEIHAFDPTPKAVAFVKAQNLSERFHFHALGVSDHDGTARFHLPKNPANVSHSVLPRGVSEDDFIEVPMQRLTTIMKSLGHEHIDVLKMDIEGAEYGVIKDMLDQGVKPPQVLIEYHHRFVDVGLGETAASVKLLQAHGYRIFYISPDGKEYSFILDAA